MQEELYNREKDMGLMEVNFASSIFLKVSKNILADLSIWFPNFNSYSTSVLRYYGFLAPQT